MWRCDDLLQYSLLNRKLLYYKFNKKYNQIWDCQEDFKLIIKIIVPVKLYGYIVKIEGLVTNCTLDSKGKQTVYKNKSSSINSM
jgi:hypothetical protein